MSLDLAIHGARRISLVNPGSFQAAATTVRVLKCAILPVGAFDMGSVLTTNGGEARCARRTTTTPRMSHVALRRLRI